MGSKQIEMETLNSIYNCKIFSIRLQVFFFCFCDSLTCIANWAAFLHEDCPKPYWASIHQDFCWFVGVEIRYYLTTSECFFYFLESTLLMIFSFPGCGFLCQVSQRFCDCSISWDESGNVLCHTQE